MRDGIPHTLPVPVKWRSAVACADRAADRGTERVTKSLAEAIAADLAKSLPVLHRILGDQKSEIQSCLPGLETIELSDRLERSAKSTLDEQKMLIAIQKHVNTGVRFNDAVAKEVELAARKTIEERFRQIRQDLATKTSIRELSIVSKELERAKQEINFGQICAAFTSATSSKKINRPNISADDDLRVGQ